MAEQEQAEHRPQQASSQTSGVRRRDVIAAIVGAVGGGILVKSSEWLQSLLASGKVPFEVEANWQKPFSDGEVTPELISLVARTLPTDRARRAGWTVSHTNFTTPDLNWPVQAGDPEQGAWRIMRAVPNDQGISSVIFDGTQAGATPGQELTFGFDVYGSNTRTGQPGRVLSPDGPRRVFFKQKP